MDLCEELGDAYGRLPMEIAALPWVQVRAIFASFMRRKAREREFQIQVAQLGAMGSVSSLMGGGAAPVEDGVDSLQVRELAGMGFPVTVRKAS